MKETNDTYNIKTDNRYDDQPRKTNWLPLLLLPVFFLLGWYGNQVSGSNNQFDGTICDLNPPSGSSLVR